MLVSLKSEYPLCRVCLFLVTAGRRVRRTPAAGDISVGKGHEAPRVAHPPCVRSVLLHVPGRQNSRTLQIFFVVARAGLFIVTTLKDSGDKTC